MAEPNEGEGDFYRRRMRQIHVWASEGAGGSNGVALVARMKDIRELAKASLGRPRSNGPDFDRLEKLEGDVKSRDVDIHIMRGQIKDLEQDLAAALRQRRGRGPCERFLAGIGGAIDEFLRLREPAIE